MTVLFAAFFSFAHAEGLKLYKFAESLFNGGDFYRAIGEYKRYIFYNPSGSLAGEAAFKIGLSYLGAEKWDSAIKAFEDADIKYRKKLKERQIDLICPHRSNREKSKL